MCGAWNIYIYAAFAAAFFISYILDWEFGLLPIFPTCTHCYSPRVPFHTYSVKIMLLCLAYFKYCCKLKKIIYKVNYLRTKFSLKCYLDSINSKTLNFILYSHFINLDHKNDNFLIILEPSIQVLIKTQKHHSNLYLWSIWLVSYKLYENLMINLIVGILIWTLNILNMLFFIKYIRYTLFLIRLTIYKFHVICQFLCQPKRPSM